MKGKILLLPLFLVWGSLAPGLTARGASVYPGPGLPLALKELKLSSFIQLTPAGIQQLTGKKLNWQQKVSFAFLKGKMKKALRKNPGITVGEFLAVNKTFNTAMWIVLGVLVLMLLVFVFLINQLPH